MKKLKELLADQLSSKISLLDKNELISILEYPSNPQMGEISLPCFKLSKLLKKSPELIAEELKGEIHGEFIDHVESTSGYLNVYINKQWLWSNLINEILQSNDQFGSVNIGKGKCIVFDYSSPNIAKPFHVGHLRSTVIGNSLTKIFSFMGYNCVSVNHLGDWGTQFGKLIVAYQLWGEKEEIEKTAIDALLHLYVKFHEEAEANPELEEQARAWFVKMEQGDEEALSLWRWFVDISLQEFDKIYKLLGVSFDSFTGESFYNDKMGEVVAELQEKNLLEEDEGASIVRLDSYDMPPALILKKDGSSLYHTRDLAAAIYRKKTYDFEKAIYVTDYAQNLHFKQWFKIIELMDYDWSEKLVHVPFGRVRLDGAGLSTRKGNVVRLDELLQQSISKILSIIEEKNSTLDNKEEVARQVGVGAVIFNDLSSNRIKDIDFSWDEILNFNGETGPYLQYTHARICSILRKAIHEYSTPISHSIQDFDVANISDPVTFEVLKELSMFSEQIELAMDKLEPSMVSRYLLDLAQKFNRFYNACPILVDDEVLRATRLSIVKSVQIVLRNGLRLIGLDAPEKL